MFSSRNNISVQCQICGFPFAILVAEGVRPAWCPSCGAEFTCSSVEINSDDNILNPNVPLVMLPELDSFTENNILTEQLKSGENIIVTENTKQDNNLIENNYLDSEAATANQTNQNQNNYCNDNSAFAASKHYRLSKRLGILAVAVSVQIIALIMLPVVISSMVANINWDDNTNITIDENNSTKMINSDLPESVSPANIQTQQLMSFRENNSISVNSVESKSTNNNGENKTVLPDVLIKNQNDQNQNQNQNPNEIDPIINKTISPRDDNDNENDSDNDSERENDDDNYDSEISNFFSFIDIPCQSEMPQSEIPQSEIPSLPENNKSPDKDKKQDLDLLAVNTSENIVGKNKNENKNEDKNNKTNDIDNDINSINDIYANKDNYVDEVETEEEYIELSYEKRLERAKEQLFEGNRLSVISPERSLRIVIQAIKQYWELGQDVPLEAKWILGRAYVMQRWGEALVENIPRVESMAISSDGQWLWCRCDDNTVWIWDIFRSKRTLGGFKLDSGGLGIIKLVFTPDFRFAVGVGIDGLVRVWNMESSEPERSVVVLRGKVLNPADVQISPDGRWLVVSGIIGGGGQSVGQGRVQDVRESGYRESSLRESSYSEISGVNGSGAVWLWDLDLVKQNVKQDIKQDVKQDIASTSYEVEPVILRGHSKPVRVIRISEDSGWLVTGSDDATARVYNLKSMLPGAEQTVLKGHQSGIMTVSFSVKGGWIATGSQDNTIRVWRLSGQKSVSQSLELRGHIGWVSSLVADRSGEYLVSGSFDKTVRIWKIPVKKFDSAAVEEPIVIQTEQGSVRKLLLTRDGKMLISLGGDSSLRLWGIGENGKFDVKNTILIRNRLLPITNVEITSDDRWLIFNYTNQKNPMNSGIRMLNLQIEELLKSAETYSSR
ncbi:MAG: WD40 repeat domain-containing protein [Planctomycetaceae bacterium]|jgi:WD40 repeat protein|nr:WD40 repeat domain-containing protein [Planctomycetaceae bacterium]